MTSGKSFCTESMQKFVFIRDKNEKQLLIDCNSYTETELKDFSRFYTSNYYEIRNNTPKSREVINATLYYFLVKLNNHYSDFHSLSNDFLIPNPICMKFLELIDNQIANKHTVKECAGDLNISITRLNILLKKYLNTSASVLIKNRLAQEAKKELLYTGGSISETAYKLGFSEISNFTRFFKKQKGLTPSRFTAMFPE